MADPVETKNLIDLYKVISEETRHTATVFWGYAIAILTFQSTAIGFAINQHTIALLSAVIMIAGGWIAFCMSRLLFRQALDRADLVSRLKKAEDLLRPTYGDCFKPIGGGPNHTYKSTDLARTFHTQRCEMFALSGRLCRG